MISFRKLSAASRGSVLRAYFTENAPDPEPEPPSGARRYDPGGRLTSYYLERDSRATWRRDMPRAVADALGIDPTRMPKNAELDRLFEGKRGDTGAAWSKHKREISAYDFTFAPHKSVTLAAEFAATPAESAAIWNAIDRANDAAMRYVAREIGWARKGAGGEDGADPGGVGWVSFRHHAARPTMTIQDGKAGQTYLVDVPIDGDPHCHIHNAMWNVVVTESGRVGSLDTARLHTRVHEFGAYAQARLADELRRLGIGIEYDADEQAVVVAKIPQLASDTFSKSRRQVLRNARDFVAAQGLDWENLSAERKQAILAQTGVATRLAKNGGKTEREIWRAQAAAIGWHHDTVLDEVHHPHRTDTERFDAAYQFAARHLAQEFETAAVIDHDKLRLYAARGLIGTGIAGAAADIDRVVELIETRGLELKGEAVALIVGEIDEKVRVTNTAQVRIEETLAAEVKRAAGHMSGALPADAIKRAIDASGLDFTSEPEHGAAQLAAIYALGQGGALTLLTGVAGAGKTTLLQPLVAAWKEDRRFDPAGRQVIGVSTAWRQADALRDAGITTVFALQPLLQSIARGEFQSSANTVLVIDELSQVGPRSLLPLLELQARTGMTIKGLGDRDQAQAIEAGDSIEILRRALPKEAQPEILTTIRQVSARDREIAGLFREGKAADALGMKRADGTARLIGGDQDQVVDRIADFYLRRRDLLRASGSTRGITISVLTNEDAADISRAVRAKLKQRGEIGRDEKIYRALAPRGPTSDKFDLPIATGDRLRLYRRTFGQVGGRLGHIGNNGDVVEVVGQSELGLTLRLKDGRIGEVEWRRLSDERTGRLLLGFGHALTIDAAQGITSDEHIDALPRGSAGITAFKGYVAESRARFTNWTLVAEGAVHDAEKMSRALGDARPVTHEDLWARIGKDMSEKPYKALGMDLAKTAAAARDQAVETFLRQAHKLESWQLQGHDIGTTARSRARANVIRQSIGRSVAALDEALQRNAAASIGLAADAAAHLRSLRASTEADRQRLLRAAAPANSRSAGVR